jgi:hypothetical protein
MSLEKSSSWENPDQQHEPLDHDDADRITKAAEEQEGEDGDEQQQHVRVSGGDINTVAMEHDVEEMGSGGEKGAHGEGRDKLELPLARLEV